MKSFRFSCFSVIVTVLGLLLAIPVQGTAKWWDKFGTPEYGGTMNYRAASMTNLSFDPLDFFGGDFQRMYLEGLFYYDWTIDRNTYPFTTDYVPAEYYSGLLAAGWEWTDPQTWTVRLRQGIHWQNKAPVNGREFIADDVVFTYNRLLGLGGGSAKANPMWAGMIPDIAKVTAVNKYTVQFKIKTRTPLTLSHLLGPNVGIVPREWADGNTKELKNAVGTGPWLPVDYVAGSTFTLNKNPGYWGKDERHPQNRIPYMDTVKVIRIADLATTLAALRTGKVDLVAEARGLGPTWQQGESLAKTNPEIQQGWWPVGGPSLELRCDKKPFTDIRVRKALNMAIDRKSIAKGHYGGIVDGTPSGFISPMYSDFTTPYDQWPADLQAEYSYNPARAKQLLAEAGYPKGFKTNCLAASSDDLTLLQIIKSKFADIGVDMTINSVDPGTEFMMLQGGKNDQMDLNNVTGMTFSPGQSLALRTQADHFNYTHNNDPDFEALYAGIMAVPDMDKAKPLIKEADLYVVSHHWAVNTFPKKDPLFWQPYLKGYSGELVQDGPGAYFARWWIDQGRKKTLGR